MMTPEQFNKLPKWAQEEFNNLCQQRDTAVQKLHTYLNTQEKSRVYTEDMVCLEKGSPTFLRSYVQTHAVTFEHAGVRLYILLRGDGPEEVIDVKWEQVERRVGDVTMQPRSFQQIYLFNTKGGK